MRLGDLHSYSVQQILMFENLDPKQEEGLAYLAMMAARQGINPEKFTNRVRGFVDPGARAQFGGKARFEKWIETATQGDTRTGRAFGRRVRVTVLESALIHEGFGNVLVRKIRKILGNERKESALVKRYLDQHPALAAIQRYARNTDEDMIKDEGFWRLVDKVTGGRGNAVRTLAVGTFHLDESRSLLDEEIIYEARMSEVMRSLGLDDDTVNDLLSDFGLRDDDYDLARLKNAAMAGPRNVAAGVRAVGRYGAEAGRAAISKGGEVLQKGKELIKKPFQDDEYKERNIDLADEVIVIAGTLLSTGVEPEKLMTQPETDTGTTQVAQSITRPARPAVQPVAYR